MRHVFSITRVFCAFLAASSIVACSGGSTTPPSIEPVVSASAPVAGASSQRATVVLTLRRPTAKTSSAKHRAYVSPSTIGVILQVADTTAGTSASYGYDVSPAEGDPSSVCGPTDPTTGVRMCSLGLPLSGGDTVNVTATIYDTVPSGTADSGHALATGSSGKYAVLANRANTIALTLAGIPAGLATTYVGANGDSAPTFEKQAMATVHAIDYQGNDIDTYDAKTNYETPFTVTIADHGDDAACSTSCSGFNFGRTMRTESVSAPESIFQTFYLDQTPGTNGTGSETPSTPPYYDAITATSGIAALSPSNDATYVVPLFAYPSSLTLAGAGTSGTGYADQYHAPDGSTGYTVDNACAGLVTEGAPGSAPYGASFAFSAKTNGSCTATLGDGAGDTASLPISVSGIATYAPAVAQMLSFGGSKGVAVNSIAASLANPPNAGNTLVLIVSQGLSTNTTSVSTPAGYTLIGSRASFTNLPGYAVFAKDVTADADQSVTIAYPTGVTGALSYYFAEFQYTSASLITAVVAKNGQQAVASSTTAAVTPDAPNTIVYTAAMSSFDGYSALGAVTDPYTASNGYAEAFVPGATGFAAAASASLDVQDITEATAVSTTNTFSATPNTSGSTSNSVNPYTTNIIFWVRPRAANS